MVRHDYFITGTDTEIGKTFIACALLRKLKRQGIAAIGMKPVAAGTRLIDGEEINEDVAALLEASSLPAPLGLVNPYCFPEPVAPHLAARRHRRAIDLQHIRSCFHALCEASSAVIVEGVGGFRVPLNDTEDSADLAVALDLPVILVVGVRLGCINHALLTAEAIQARGLRLAGWVANTVEPHMQLRQENVVALKERINAPLLGVVPHVANSDVELGANALGGFPTAA